MGKQVSVLVPKYEDWSRLPVRDDRGELLGFAEPDSEFQFLDARGAIEAKRRADAHRRSVKALDRSAPDVNPLLETLSLAARLPPPTTAPVGATIGMSGLSKAIVSGLSETPHERLTREMQQRESDAAEVAKATQRMLQSMRGEL